MPKSKDDQNHAELNKIKIPLADLRVQVVSLMKDGFTEVPLGDLLYILKNIRVIDISGETEKA